MSAVAIASTVLCGCGESGPVLVPVEGKVTWQGQPVRIGSVAFVPIKGGQPAIGMISSGGRFELKSHAGRMGIEPGEYRVAIRAYEGSFIENNVRYVVPERFARTETSGLTTTVPTDTAGTLKLNYDLK